MRISKFWKTLDALTDAATDRREWASLLGDEFGCVVVNESGCPLPLVRSTGTPATSIACPSPGGEGCPRRVVHHDDGTFRAVCGDSPKACADLDLNKNDIMIYGLDRVGLARSIAAAFDLSGRPASFDRRLVFRIGSHDVFAGRGFPVFLTVPGPLAREDAAQFDDMIAHPGPKLLLAPTSSSIPPQLAATLDREGVVRMALEDLVHLDDRGQLQPCQPSTVVFADLRAQIVSGTDNAVSNLAWALPSNARWEEIGFNGKTRNPRLDTMEKICAALGTTVDEFMKPAQSPEEAEIARLVSALPAPLRLQLLGFAKALAAEADQSRPKEGEGDE